MKVFARVFISVGLVIDLWQELLRDGEPRPVSKYNFAAKLGAVPCHVLLLYLGGFYS